MKAGDSIRSQTTIGRVGGQSTPIRTNQTQGQTSPVPAEVGDARTTAQMRPEGTFAPTETDLGQRSGSAVAQTLLSQKDATKRRAGRGRTGNLQRLMTSQRTLVAQTRKPLVRATHKEILALGPAIQQALDKAEA